MMRRSFQILGRGLAYGAVGLGVAMAGAFAALHTPPGARFTERQIAEQSSGHIMLQGLRWQGLAAFEFDTLILRTGAPDAAADLEVRGGEVAVQLLPLLTRRLVVETLSAAQLVVRSTDTPAPAAAEEEMAVQIRLPELPLGLVLKNLAIADLQFMAPAYGLEGRYSARGHASLDRQFAEADIYLAMQRLDLPGALTATVKYGGATETPIAQVDFTDQDGAPLAALTGYDSGALTLQVKGFQQDKNFVVDLTGDMAKGPAVAARLSFLPEAGRVLGQATFNLSRLAMPEIETYLGQTPAVDFVAQLAGTEGLAVSAQTALQGRDLQAAIDLALTLPRGQFFLADNMQWRIAAAPVTGAALAGMGGTLDFNAQGALTENGIVTIESAALSAASARAQLSGQVPLAQPLNAQLIGSIDLPELAAFAPSLQGNAALSFKVQPHDADKAATQLGATGHAAVVLADNRTVTLNLQSVSWLNEAGEIDISADLTTGTLAALDTALQGTARLTLRATGPAADPSAMLQFSATDFAYAGVQADTVEATVKLLTPMTDAAGMKAALNAVVAGGAARAALSTVLGWDGTTLRADSIVLGAAPVQAAGAFSYDTANAALYGKLDVAANDFAALAKWPGLLAAQPALAGLSANADLQVTATGKAVALRGALNGLSVPAAQISVQQAMIEARAGLDDVSTSLQAVIGARGVNAGAVQIPATNVKLTPARAGLDFAVDADLAAPIGGRMAGAGTASFTNNVQLTLRSFAGVLEGQDFALLAPATLSIDGNAMRLSDTTLNVAEGNVALAYVQAAAGVQGALNIKNVALGPVLGGLWGIELPLVLSANATLRGPVQAPALKFDVQANAALPEFAQPLGMTFAGQSKGRDLAVQGRIAGGEDGAVLDINGQVPFGLDLSGTAAAVSAPRPINLLAKGALPLAPLAYMAFDNGSTLGGRVVVDAVIRGQMAAPSFAGTLCLEDGAAGLVASGTTLANGTGCLTLQKDGRFSGALAATDGRRGTARIDLSGALNRPHVSGQVRVNDLRALDGDIGQMVVESDLNFEIGLETALPGYVRGAVTVVSADLPIPAGAEESVPTLNVVHVNQSGGTMAPAEAAPAAATPGTALALDLAIKVPGQFFLRGRGIESEWTGNIGVAGTLAEPVISGDIKLIKGVASTGAAALKFTEGAVRIVPAKAGTLPRIFLNMVSESRVGGVTARMQLSGPVRQPEIGFSSEPSLPEDEILARLLFGKPAAQLTTSEALSLSAAALELSGAFGTSAGFMDKVRRGLGVDRLSIDASTDAPEQSSLSAGKYLTPDLYLSVRQGADGANPDLSVEYQLNDKVTITGDQKGAGGEAVGVEYRLDY